MGKIKSVICILAVVLVYVPLKACSHRLIKMARVNNRITTKEIGRYPILYVVLSFFFHFLKIINIYQPTEFTRILGVLRRKCRGFTTRKRGRGRGGSSRNDKPFTVSAWPYSLDTDQPRRQDGAEQIEGIHRNDIRTPKSYPQELAREGRIEINEVKLYIN